jgi:hypothetical protein
MERGGTPQGYPTAPVEVSALIPRLDDLDYWTEDEDWAGSGLGQVLRETMSEDYADADDEAHDEALDTVLDAMSAAEAFSFQKALRQIQSGAGRALANPVLGQVAQTALPAGAGALGTPLPGPAGPPSASLFPRSQTAAMRHIDHGRARS